MAETKNFLSLTGLQRYDAKIKALIKSQGKDVTDKLIDLIGAAAKGADTKTILDRVADLETAVGNVQKLPGEVKELVAAIVGESTRAQAAEGTLGNRLNVIEGEGEGSIKKALADAKEHANELNTAMDSRVDALETAIGEGGSVANKITTAIEGLDADITSAAIEAGKGIQVQVVEADGKITNVNVTGNFDNKYDTLGAADTVNSALDIYKGTNDAAVAAAKKAGDDAQADVDALEAKVGTVAEGKTVVQMISEAQTAATYDDTQVKQDIATNASNISGLTTRMGTAEGKITALESKAAANETAISTLKGEGEGSVKKQIDDAFNDFATKISDDGVVNTYKELVDYCATHKGEAATMAGNISANATAISELNTKVGAIPEDANATTVIDYVDKKVEAEKSRSDNAIKTAVEALDAELSQTAGDDGLALHITEVDGKITAISGSIKANTYDAYGAAKAVQGETTKTVKELEDDLAAIVAISDAEIDALFNA